MLDRIKRLNPHLQCYVHVAEESALRAADSATEELQRGFDRGPLHGVPISIKDIFFDKSFPTTAGMSTIPPSWRANDAIAVARARAAGAIILGTTVTTEGVFSGYRPGQTPPRNPWQDDFWPGASSSGPAVATAAGLCFGAYGSDTGGSVRFPAAANGITGIKPTWGRVPRTGTAPLAPSLDHIGTFGRNVVDADILLSVVEGYHRTDSTSLREVNNRPPSRQNLSGLRVGVDPSLEAALPTDVSEALQRAVQLMEDLGAQVVKVAFPDVVAATQAWETIASVEAMIAHSETYPAAEDQYGSELKVLLRKGREQTTAQLAAAEAHRVILKLALDDLFRSIDFFVCPAFPGQIPTLEEWDRAADEHSGSIARLTAPINLAGTPTVTLPIETDSRSMPIGLQICGPAESDGSLAIWAQTIQSRSVWHLSHPKTN
ncbi:amidase [Paenarthrobacter sp. NPDC057981]|uniref:amidase n=1 Tax=Paenarthrobacter sp. NPDC057981 TaxID=3346297 RepID=UPI0036DA9034